MKREWLLIIFVGLIIFLAGCAKEKPPTELQFKNDIVTIPAETYFVSNVAPYEKGKTNKGGETSIQFELHNNGDQKIPYLEVDFFDVPGFKVTNLECQIFDKDQNLFSLQSIPKCTFTDIEPLDVRSITIQLESTDDVSSPTPHTVSFGIRYTYFGFREANIPVIDSLTRKQPLTKFRQSDPSVGPIVLDIDPSIEREVVIGDKTIKEHWAVGGNSPLPFSAKFNFKHVESLSEKVKDVNISENNLRVKLVGLENSLPCNFNSDGTATFNIGLPEENPQHDFGITNLAQYSLISEKSALVPFDTLLCTFKPNISQPEYTATISAVFAYKYEFIKSQNFVVQPLPE